MTTSELNRISYIIHWNPRHFIIHCSCDSFAMLTHMACTSVMVHWNLLASLASRKLCVDLQSMSVCSYRVSIDPTTFNVKNECTLVKACIEIWSSFISNSAIIDSSTSLYFFSSPSSILSTSIKYCWRFVHLWLGKTFLFTKAFPFHAFGVYFLAGE